MGNYLYAITMKTPIGDRRGELILTSLEGMCIGSIHLLASCNAVEGEIQPDGSGSLSGTLQTLLRRFHFTARGYFIPEGLHMELKCGNGTYTVIGKRKEG